MAELRRTAWLLSLLFLNAAPLPLRADEGTAPAGAPAPPPAETPRPSDPLLGWSITPGIGVRVISLDVKQKSTGDTGTLTNDGSFSDPIYLAFDVESPSWMVSDNVGFSIRSHSQTFRLTRQQVPSTTTSSGNDYANLGTSVNGYYSYIGPTVFYRTPDASGDTRWGFGYGYWKAWFKGDIILAPDGAAVAGMPKTQIGGSIDGSTGPVLFFQGRGKKGVFEMAFSWVDFSGPDLRYSLRELNMSIGYIFTF